MADAVGAASPLGPYDILVALADDLSDRHLDAVEATVGLSIPGILVGRDLAELQTKAAASLAALTAPTQEAPLRVEIVPRLPIGLVEGTGFALAGRHADPEALRSLLGHGKSLVCLTGHGDGIDGDLGPLVLCPLDRDFLATGTMRPPTCRVSGHCHRCDARLGSQILKLRQLHPSAIRARAMIWNTCVGWPSRKSFVDRTHGAGMRLAVSTSIGALVTTSRISLASPVTIDALCAALVRGVPIGEAVAGHNASAQARRAGHRLLLFGDPLLRVAPGLARDAAPQPRLRPAQPARQAEQRLAVEAPPDRVADTRLVATIARLHAEVDEDRRADFAELCTALAREGLESHWARVGASIDVTPAVCPHCRAPANRHALQVAASATRHLVICRRCEVAADIPERPLIAVRLQAGGICRVTAYRPPSGAPWLGAIVARRCRPYASETGFWQQGADGTPARRMDVDAVGSEAPTTLAAVFLVGDRLHIFSRPYAASALAPLPVEVPT
ncbi:hypothetical protein [Aurantimonas endophytica]|uniref:Uncharacterized protein n=1 Tax=Aurantimonas endophytica TaxID=1522175 RepID=A0A7W6HB60_9HYPH|nr:hypothetical protein [Aurantimonas endophytica]MBB4001887.1 hypothetical protein [Aurantimonas endophytica]MCO6402478.1 hypothetical protein [Aurantimonas endophytica]